MVMNALREFWESFRDENNRAASASSCEHAATFGGGAAVVDEIGRPLRPTRRAPHGREGAVRARRSAGVILPGGVGGEGVDSSCGSVVFESAPPISAHLRRSFREFPNLSPNGNLSCGSARACFAVSRSPEKRFRDQVLPFRKAENASWDEMLHPREALTVPRLPETHSLEEVTAEAGRRGWRAPHGRHGAGLARRPAGVIIPG